MLEVRINVSEIKEVIKDLAEAPGKIFTMMYTEPINNGHR